MSFYITAPSNSSMDLYPDNTLTDYTVHLPKQIDLDGPYEVALTSFQYTRSWNNVSLETNLIKFSINELEGEASIAIGFYETAEDLLTAIAEAVTKAIKKLSLLHEDLKAYVLACSPHKFIQLVYREKNRRVVIYLRPLTSITFHEKLTAMLGYEKTHFHYQAKELPRPAEIISNSARKPPIVKTTKEEYVELLKIVKTKEFHSGREIDLLQGLYMLYIYCNILEEQIVGNTMVPLLKIVPVEGVHGENITREYINPQYVPVFMTHFSDLEIDIRDDTGAKVPFERGRVLATLHFRRKSDL